ncbi:choice-of-anchor tandem repeat GloVer-containing protein [Candidatus Auribacterota bacterium]
MKKLLITSAMISILFLCLAMPLHATSFTILHVFEGGANDGANPFGDITLSGSTIYGMTNKGGDTDFGTIFKMEAGNPSSFTLLHEFQAGGDDGKWPQGELSLSGSTLYGLTYNGGDGNVGTIFKIETDDPASFTILHEFAGGANDGSLPWDSLTLSGSTLYGMTRYGGGSNGGTLFKMEADNPSSFTLLHEFAGGANDGLNPEGDVTISGSTLYGVTRNGGASDGGTVFKIDVTGNGFTLLHKFLGGADDGFDPEGSLTLSGSTLYGTTGTGGDLSRGNVFTIDTAGNGFTILHEFEGAQSDGQHPTADITVSGNQLFGTTQLGGFYNKGTVFEMAADDPSSSYTILHDFAGGANDGTYPYGSLTLSGSTLYGMTYVGGDSNKGVIFSMGVEIDEVPEPSTLLLLLPFLAGLYWIRKRRKK